MTARAGLLALLLLALLPLGGCASRAKTPEARSPAEPRPEAQVPAGPASEPAVDRAACCGQCIDATRTDPTGADLALVPCHDYRQHVVNGAPALSPACSDWFAGNPLLVQDCR